MREILFRGKSVSIKGDGPWVYGGLFIDHKGNAYIVVESYDGTPMCEQTMIISVEPRTVGQCTGLKDKNGAKIFEGDVVCYQFGQYHVKFVPDRGGWYPFASGDGCGCCESDTIQPSTDGIVDNVIVIGNIHDNPELVKGEEK